MQSYPGQHKTDIIIVVGSSVAEPGCLSRIPDPDFYPSRIPDLWSRIQKQLQKRGAKKNLLSYLFFVATNFTKFRIILFWTAEEKNFGPNFKELPIELFTQKVITKLSKIWVWDPGSEIRDPRSGIRDPGSGKNLFRIPDPRVKKAPDPGSGSATMVGSKSRKGLDPGEALCGTLGLFNVL